MFTTSQTRACASSRPSAALFVIGLFFFLSSVPAAHAVDVNCDIARGDAAGWSVATGGDLDGDGIHDIVVGAPCAFVDSMGQVGRVFVFSGVDQSRLLLLKGEHASQHFGSAVDILPDINNDNRDEIIIGSMGYDVPVGGGQVRNAAGKVEVYDIDGNVLREVLGETAGATCGEAVSSVGDLTGDDIADMMIGAGNDRVDGTRNGRAYLISGNDSATVDVSDGLSEFDNWGSIVASAPDIDGDFIDDVIVASSQANQPLTEIDPLEPDILFEEKNGRIAVLSGANLTTEIFSAYGGVEERLGRSATAAGSLGMFAGATGTEVNGKNKAGTVTLFDWNGNVDLILTEPAPQVTAAFGTAIAHIGDIDDSTVSSIAASAPNGVVNGIDRAGRVHAMRGDDGTLHWTISGWSKDLKLGQSLDGSSDFNNDGIMDVLVGAPGGSPRGRRGAGYAIGVSGETGEELFRVGGRRGVETRIYVTGWRYGRVPHVRSMNHRARRREVKRNTFRRLIDGSLSIAVLDDIDPPTPGEMKLVLSTGHGADDDTIMVVRAGRRSPTLSKFSAFDSSYTGGVNVGAGDVQGDPTHEIIAVQADSADNNVRVRIYERVDEDLLGNIIWLERDSFNAFSEGEVIEPGSIPVVANGANVVIGNVDGDGDEELVVAPVEGTPVVRIIGGSGGHIREWLAYFSGESGVNLAVGDLNNDGTNEIVTGPGSGMPRVRVFESNGEPFENPDTGQAVSFFAFDLAMTAGVHVAVADVDLDGRGEIIVTTGEGVTAEMRAYEMDGTLVPDWESVKPMGPTSDRAVIMATTDRFLRH